MFFSIVIPVYNAEGYLDTCINSILSQNFKDYEIILINDGSKDSSGEIIDLLSTNYSFILSLHQENNGPSSARNLGIRNARGTYVLFVDADDNLKPNALDILYKHLYLSNLDCLCFGYNTIRVKEKRSYDLSPDTQIYNSKISISKNYIQIINSYFFSVVWNKAYKLEMLLKYDIKMNNNLYIGEDYCFNLAVFDKINSYMTINCSLYNYVIQNPESITNIYDVDKINQLRNLVLIKKSYLLCNSYLSEEEKYAEISYDYVKLSYTIFIYSFKKETGYTYSDIYINIKKQQAEYPYKYSVKYLKYFNLSKKIIYYFFTHKCSGIVFMISALYYIYKYKSCFFKDNI